MLCSGRTYSRIGKRGHTAPLSAFFPVNCSNLWTMTSRSGARTALRIVLDTSEPRQHTCHSRVRRRRRAGSLWESPTNEKPAHNQSERNMKTRALHVLRLILSTLLLLGLCAANGAGAAGKEASSDWIRLYEPNTHNEMPCRLMKPIAFDQGKRYPVIVSLHGAGGRGEDNRKQLRDWNRLLADTKRRTDYPCYVLAPQSKSLWDKTHLENIKGIIKALPSVDMDRIYILGHSMGGHGTYILIQVDTGYFAAAAPSAGSGLRRTGQFIDAARIKDIPIWAFHGDKDRVCPFERDQKVFDEMKKMGGNMKLTRWEGDGHGVSRKFIAGADNGTTELSSKRCDPETVFLKWLFKQKRSEKKK
jgi:predicted peptidase